MSQFVSRIHALRHPAEAMRHASIDLHRVTLLILAGMAGALTEVMNTEQLRQWGLDTRLGYKLKWNNPEASDMFFFR